MPTPAEDGELYRFIIFFFMLVLMKIAYLPAVQQEALVKQVFVLPPLGNVLFLIKSKKQRRMKVCSSLLKGIQRKWVNNHFQAAHLQFSS